MIFKKLVNGNVLVLNGEGNVLGSFTSSKQVLKHPTTANSLIITDDSSVQESNKGLVVSYSTVDKENCEPPIVATDINELITALSSNFFLD